MIAYSRLLVLLVSILAVHGGPVRRLQSPIENLGENPEPVFGRYPLGECQGDCDKDEHCGSGLVCMLERKPNEAVPGCTGGEEDGTSTNYCIKQSDATRDEENGAVVVSVSVVNTSNQAGEPAVDQQQQESSAFSHHAIISLATTASSALMLVFN